MSTNEKNRFSTLLEELISISGVKNSGLAKALQYDASYISKWVSGRLLPTEKTKKKILSGLSHEIVNQSTSEGFVFIITCILYIYWYFSSITSSVLNTLSF